MRIEEILPSYRGKLLAFIERRVHDPDLAEDVLQEGLIKALRAADELRDDERLVPWLYCILKNAIIGIFLFISHTVT